VGEGEKIVIKDLRNIATKCHVALLASSFKPPTAKRHFKTTGGRNKQQGVVAHTCNPSYLGGRFKVSQNKKFVKPQFEFVVLATQEVEIRMVMA
jgi:hypothetical protein